MFVLKIEFDINKIILIIDFYYIAMCLDLTTLFAFYYILIENLLFS